LRKYMYAYFEKRVKVPFLRSGHIYARMHILKL